MMLFGDKEHPGKTWDNLEPGDYIFSTEPLYGYTIVFEFVSKREQDEYWKIRMVHSNDSLGPPGIPRTSIGFREFCTWLERDGDFVLKKTTKKLLSDFIKIEGLQ